jgi:four helix bundle protein
LTDVSVLWDVADMGYYRELAVWQRARALAIGVYRCTENFPMRERYGLAAQMRRAAVSVISNIAEGCGRQGDRELIRFLKIARGSTHELECQLILAHELGYARQEDWIALDSESREVSRMLSGLIRYTRNS